MRLSVQRFANACGKPHRALVHAWLIFALLMAQLGAFTHALSHVVALDTGVEVVANAAPPTPNSDSNSSHQADADCALCGAFAATGAALASQPAAWSVLDVAQVARTPDAYVVCVATLPPFSSRAPPAFLA
jgi:hypothetical protein